MGRYKKGLEYKGCDEDCLKCPYPDCLKPASLMRPVRDITNIRRADYEAGESQARMFTLELGGFGGAMPNVNRKFYK